MAGLYTSDVEVSDEGSSTAGPQGRRQLLLGGGGLALGLLAAPGSSEAAASTALPNRFASSEGFAFNFPAGWIVAFDRSGGQDNGAVTVVGNFATIDTVGVFREELPEEVWRAGFSGDAAFQRCVAPQQNEDSTMRFGLVSDGVVETPGGPAYDFEYSIEMCRGEIQEGRGGALRCLAPSGQELGTLRRHHAGRCIFVGKYAYIMNASSSEERWPELRGTWATVVASFAATA